jgi:hypothetical protein
MELFVLTLSYIVNALLTFTFDFYSRIRVAHGSKTQKSTMHDSVQIPESA